ncbi:alpha/beta-hydrolase [Gonapodya prolifera JEL478]|uniref:Alpha/beta-hydrolase n=1 Tax=Gonapodya prolifera (strain JEL478) TaxID=1344416 RepID=A0A139A859_GONPJ|nr:alpha/beta-hydrolase [Gonapodya prolifera JEL478]|eukprot:KXS12970.1 alpha/beta-hydrolase [Gonapodya prolifera JEL478]
MSSGQRKQGTSGSGILGPSKVDFVATTIDGLRISALLEKKAPLSDDVVVIAHGSLDNKRAPVIRGLVENLPYNVLTFDFRGMGESDGESNLGNYSEEKDDLHAICEHVSKELRMKIIAIIAHSKGTITTMLYATAYQSRSPLLILCNPPFSHDKPPADPELARVFQEVIDTGKPAVRGTYRNKGRVKEMVLTREIILKRKEVDLMKLAKKLSPHVEVQVLTAENDEAVPVEDSRLYEKAFADRNLQMTVLRDCGHYYRTPREQGALALQVRKYIMESVDRRKAAEQQAPTGPATKKKGGFKLKL